MDKFLSLLLTGIALGCIYGLTALGYSLIYKASGLMTFVQGDILTLGAFLGLTFYSILGLPFAVSFVLTMVISYVVGLLIERGVIRTLLNKQVGVVYVVLATIAISYIVQNGAQVAWGTERMFFPQLFSVPSVRILGVQLQSESAMCVVVSVVCMVVLHLFMTKSKLGTAMRASSMDPIAARACGIDVYQCTGITWGLAAGLASIAGMLLGPIYGVYVSLGAAYGNKGFAGAIIGGYGNMYGAIVGGIILGVVENLGSGYISSSYKNLIAYCLLILFLFLKPTGLFNEKALEDT